MERNAEFLLSSLSKMDASFDFLAFFPDEGEDTLLLFMAIKRQSGRLVLQNLKKRSHRLTFSSKGNCLESVERIE